MPSKPIDWSVAGIRLMLNAVHQNRGPQSIFADPKLSEKACKDLGDEMARLSGLEQQRGRIFFPKAKVKGKLETIFYKYKRRKNAKIPDFWQLGLSSLNSAALLRRGWFSEQEIKEFEQSKPSTPTTPSFSQVTEGSPEVHQSPPVDVNRSHDLPKPDRPESAKPEASQAPKFGPAFIQDKPREGQVIASLSQTSAASSPTSRKRSHPEDEMPTFGIKKIKGNHGLTIFRTDNSEDQSMARSATGAGVAGGNSQMKNPRDAALNMPPAEKIPGDNILPKGSGPIPGGPEPQSSIPTRMNYLHSHMHRCVKNLLFDLGIDEDHEPVCLNPKLTYSVELAELLAMVIGAEDLYDLKEKLNNFFSKTAHNVIPLSTFLRSLVGAAVTKWCLEPPPEGIDFETYMSNLDGGSIRAAMGYLFPDEVQARAEKEIFRQHLLLVVKPEIDNKAKEMAGHFVQFLPFLIPSELPSIYEHRDIVHWPEEHFPNARPPPPADPPSLLSKEGRRRGAKTLFRSDLEMVFQTALTERIDLAKDLNGEIQFRWPDCRSAIQIINKLNEKDVQTPPVVIGLLPSVDQRNITYGRREAKGPEWFTVYGGIMVVDLDSGHPAGDPEGTTDQAQQAN